MNAIPRLVLALALAWPLAVSAQLAPQPDRGARMDGHEALRARADLALAKLLDAAQSLAPSARRRAWDVQVVARGVHDAEAFDGGQIRLSSAFVESLALSDAELAMLLAHEVAHVLANDAGGHARIDPSRFGWPLLGEGRRGDGADAAHPDARRQEVAADALGFALAMRAGYDAAALRGLYRKVLAVLGNVANAAHPPVAERLRRLVAQVASTRFPAAENRE